ncbi:tRNA methyltransferase [Thiomicrospira aerophila AL3]|uniref:Carboxy-S-adenosyl-L-methionine synthase n=1 Tax=Thiomicrospira aerophila AL3 TaxID=717772 RepID=W0DYV3_9GAMM|nr:carboxy-S-adenosyl-L-methionine synthase CmoA [Thiomicrospira aerophila]AHF02154.1 tRNA methyltransferase [Thiomicrospira aerophila AL3]
MSANHKDTLFAQPHQGLKSFCFDEQVASVFPDMIERSVPSYGETLKGITELTRAFVRPNTRLYDLGCSLGAATLAMRRAVEDKPCNIIAVDNSTAMLAKAKDYLGNYHSSHQVEFVLDDMLKIDITNASVVVLNFTLQFIAPEQRITMLERIYDGLIPGGVLILSEKLINPQTQIQTQLETMHLQFKRNNGYSELEISQKRASLENVLISDSRETHLNRLKTVGFSAADSWLQHFQFASFLAIK